MNYKKKNQHTEIEALRIDLFNRINELGIGAQGVGWSDNCA